MLIFGEFRGPFKKDKKGPKGSNVTIIVIEQHRNIIFGK